MFSDVAPATLVRNCAGSTVLRAQRGRHFNVRLNALDKELWAQFYGRARTNAMLFYVRSSGHRPAMTQSERQDSPYGPHGVI
eukprot:s239_g16.t1